MTACVGYPCHASIGIYALERIAKESREDYSPVMEILTAYVREHAPRGSRAEGQPPSPDIQAILTVLGRLIPNSEREEIGRNELRTTDLQPADLSGAILYGAILRGADLARTRNLAPAQIEKAFGDETTRLPDHLKRPASWNTKTDY